MNLMLRLIETLSELQDGKYHTFQLHPKDYVNDRWQGGTVISVKKITNDRYKIGTLSVMTLLQAARFVRNQIPPEYRS